MRISDWSSDVCSSDLPLVYCFRLGSPGVRERGALMLDQVEDEIVDTRVFERARAELGSAFLRILGYFREDGVKAVDRIEHAMRTGDSASLVLPPNTLKGEKGRAACRGRVSQNV